MYKCKVLILFIFSRFCIFIIQYWLIGAYMDGSDVTEWQRLAELCVELGNIDQAIRCYSQGIHNIDQAIRCYSQGITQH